MISDAQFAAWLNDERNAHVVLLEADYRDTATDALATEYLATRPFVSQPADEPPNQTYLSLISAIPEFKQSMSDVLIGRTTSNVGKIECIGGSARTDAWLFGRDWIGRGLRLYVGDATWPKSDFRAIWSGVTADFQLDGTRAIAFVVRDMQYQLNQPIRTVPVDTGPLLGRPTPLVFGTVYNVPAVLLDATTHQYRVSDGAVASIDAVRVAGVSQSYTADAFAGTFTHAVIYPMGPVTADVTGATFGANPVDNASDLIRYIVTERGYLTDDDLDVASFIALKALCPQKLGYFVPPGEVPVYQAVDDVLNTIGGFAAVTRSGKYFVRRFDLQGDPVLAIGPSDIEQDGLQVVRVLQPVREIRLGSKADYSITQQVIGGFGGVSETELATRQSRHRNVASATNPDAAKYARTRRMPNPHAPAGMPALPIMSTIPPTSMGAPDPGTISTLFVNAADAVAEAARRMTIWGVPRYVLRCNCFVSALRLNLGDVVTLTHPRYQLEAGRNAVVIGISERLSAKRAVLDLLV